MRSKARLGCLKLTTGRRDMRIVQNCRDTKIVPNFKHQNVKSDIINQKDGMRAKECQSGYRLFFAEGFVSGVRTSSQMFLSSASFELVSKVARTKGHLKPEQFAKYCLFSGVLDFSSIQFRLCLWQSMELFKLRYCSWFGFQSAFAAPWFFSSRVLDHGSIAA